MSNNSHGLNTLLVTAWGRSGGYMIGQVGQVVGLSTPTIVCLTWLFHSLLKMPGGTYLGYSRHLYRMSICCSFMKST